MHTPSPSNKVFHWQSQQKNRWPKDSLISLVSTPRAQQPFQLVLFHKQTCTSCFTPSPHSNLLRTLLFGLSSLWSDCNSQSFILSDICIETSFYIISVPFLENYSFACLYFPHRHCGKYFLKGGNGKCPILFWITPHLSCQDVMCLVLALHWCLSTGASLQVSEEDTPWVDEQQGTFLYPTFPSTVKFKETEGLVGGWHGPVEGPSEEAAGKMWEWLGALGNCSNRGTLIHCNSGGVNDNWHIILSCFFFLENMTIQNTVFQIVCSHAIF